MSRTIRTANEIRRAWVDFFARRGHTEVPSAPLVPRGDPTLLFTSAGMVQFKDFYLAPENLPYTRAVSIQKCLRAGDLESVGRTLRHHTFFEMLGNFSFGDYFKTEAIDWAWEFVTEVLRLPESRLYTSVFEEDDEAFEIWNRRIGIPAGRIVRLGRKDNFWGPVGATGVCGPCSEIYYDAGEERGCGSPTCAPGCDCDRYLEFWNLVFPQFYREESGEYRPLAKPGIDTGAGLERIAMIMQGAPDNFHTDLFGPIVDRVLDALPKGAGAEGDQRLGVNMIADHVRALTFTISEGIYPSNEGRGYILRRILRRALTRLHTFGVDRPVLHGMVGTVARVMEDAYPDLALRAPDTAMIIRAEEESFFRTLAEGRGRFHAIAEDIKSSGGGRIDGERMFLLYDTYGLPVELTRALAAEEGIELDEEGFEEAMDEQRRRAQQRSSFEAAGQALVPMTTVSEGESSIFTGYERVEGEALIRRYRIFDRGERPDLGWSGPAGGAVEIVFDRTPFYATSGGQAADEGHIEIDGRRMPIRDVFKRGGEIVHVVEPPAGAGGLEELLRSGRSVRLRIDDEARQATAANHTATHLLHAALREVVGAHVAQAGSLVDELRLRFDFNHFQAVTAEQRRMIEDRVNGWIRESIEVATELMGYQEAVDAGAIALFDEKYGAKVRVVRIGEVSTELCGGTHLSTTGRIGIFLIVSESGVAAGVRRIEAVTGSAALRHVREIRDRLDEAAALLRAGPAEIAGRIRSLVESADSMKREIRRLERGGAGGGLDALIGSASRIHGATVAAGRIEAKDVGSLRGMADLFREKVRSGVAVLSSPQEGKMHYVVTVTDDLIERGVTAEGLVAELGALTGGGG
ncbi:MAG: alanine--tRNA ligase, partial [Candidatus Krumholzibacteria bacterium]|nr:alanine--tRNA ligase [Candidatus Krumholzibacteria bacterium]